MIPRQVPFFFKEQKGHIPTYTMASKTRGNTSQNINNIQKNLPRNTNDIRHNVTATPTSNLQDFIVITSSIQQICHHENYFEVCAKGQVQ